MIHGASLSPTKLELLAAWLPTRDWYPGPDKPELTRVAGGRFDDPDGAVGIEMLIVRVEDGPLLHVPLTYRAAPLPGAERWLVGTTEHSALGTRWVYDAVGDPVYAAVLAETIRTGGREAEEYYEEHGKRVHRKPDLSLRGAGVDVPVGDRAEAVDGDPAVIRTRAGELSIARVLADSDEDTANSLTGAWTGRDTPAVLARHIRVD